VKWELRGVGNEKNRVETEVTDVSVADGEKRYEVSVKTITNDRVIEEVDYYAVKSDGLYRTKSRFKASGAETTITYEPPLCLLRLPSKEAQDWKWDGRMTTNTAGKEKVFTGKTSFRQTTVSIKHHDIPVEVILVEFEARTDAVKTKGKSWTLPGLGEVKTETATGTFVRVGNWAEESTGAVPRTKD
jgi:hypothetical protein